AQDVDRVGRGAEHDARHRLPGRMQPSGMTERARDPDALEPDCLFGESDRELAAGLPTEAEGGPTAGARQVFRKHLRQHEPYPVRDAPRVLRPDGAVLELLLDRVVRELLRD